MLITVIFSIPLNILELSANFFGLAASCMAKVISSDFVACCFTSSAPLVCSFFSLAWAW